ncbi:DUF4198 domain-containing protein [Blastopirellula marina]|uniref:DUF4198 domain-containing protein n=1 Tax=Blastopirellula marina TaxID=124 RepID=UPI0011B0B203|nr:DUF4198 domain-containing protein [Blastopirellula marina]
MPQLVTKTSSRYAQIVTGLLCLTAVPLLGCSSESYVPVSGVVELDGKPLEDAKLIFEPMGDAQGIANGKPSYGRTDASGAFTLHCPQEDVEGAAIGEHRVRIVTTKAPEYTEQQKTKARSYLERQEAAGGNSNPQVTDEMVNAYLSDSVQPVSRETLPARYNAKTELKFTVESGKENQANFSLESK